MISEEIEFQAKPSIYGEITLCFDIDFDTNVITQILGITPNSIGRRSEMRINPFTGEQNPGFWEYRTQTVFAYDSDSIMNEMHLFLTEHIEALLRIKEEYPCDIVIRLYADAGTEADAPAVWLNKAIIKTLAILNADVDITVAIERTVEELNPTHS